MSMSMVHSQMAWVRVCGHTFELGCSQTALTSQHKGISDRRLVWFGDGSIDRSLWLMCSSCYSSRTMSGGEVSNWFRTLFFCSSSIERLLRYSSSVERRCIPFLRIVRLACSTIAKRTDHPDTGTWPRTRFSHPCTDRLVDDALSKTFPMIP